MGQKVGQKIGKYEIVAELGQGGMGVVYKARDPYIGRLVALKTITPELVADPEILKRFYREAQSAGSLHHPNIVTIYDLGESEGVPYIAMEFVEGESLQSIVNRRARIPLAAKLKLVQQFCEGLGHAHKYGVVHRDIKPANILVTGDGSVKVVDFGIVHLETTNLTRAGTFLGTIHYASPEQINDGRVDCRSDIWSVTCVIYEFIAYKKAFDASNIAATIGKILAREPDPLSRCCPGVPVDLDIVINKGLKKSVEDRYQSLDELLTDLLPIAHGLQQSFIGDLILEAKDLREKGDLSAAQDKVRAVLILDNTHGEAKRLHTMISGEVLRLAPAVKAKKLVGEAEQALGRGDLTAANRILGEALDLNPADTQARRLKERVLGEQTRGRELREAFTSGQRAMKQGDLTGAEVEFRRVLQLDQNHPEASELLRQIEQDRLSRERDFRLKEALWQVDNVVFEGHYEEAQAQLLELQNDFPNSEDIRLKLQILYPLIRVRKLTEEGQHALEQSEFAEAVRAFTEAAQVDPYDEHVRELRDRAIEQRDRLREVREALNLGQVAMHQGDPSAAEREFHKVLDLDPTNAEASTLLAELRHNHASVQEAQFQETLQQLHDLAAAGRFDDAENAFLEMQDQFPPSTEMGERFQAIGRQMKLSRLLAESQHAYTQGEFGEAVRLLNEAQTIDPTNEQVLDFKTQALRERDRLRQVREAIASGQRAMRQGHIEVAENEYQRALHLDPSNTQATNLLAQTRKEIDFREREQRLKYGLSEAETLIYDSKYDEAEALLAELQQKYPDAKAIEAKIETLNQWKAVTTALTVPAPPPAPAAPPAAPAPRSPAATSMLWADELRQSLDAVQPRAQAAPAISLAGDANPAAPAEDVLPADPASETANPKPAARPNATLMFGPETDDAPVLDAPPNPPPRTQS